MTTQTLDVNDGTLDAFVLTYCAEHGIECDGDVFGLAFSGRELCSEAEAAEIIEDAARTYGLKEA